MIPEAVSLGRASEDEYNPTLDDGNIGSGVKALPEVILIWPTGVCRKRAASCHPEVFEIRTVRRRLLPCLSATWDSQRRPDGVPSALSSSSISDSVSSSVSSPWHEAWYSSLLLSLRGTASICPCPSGSVSGSVSSVVWIVFLRGRYDDLPWGTCLIGGGEEFRLDNWLFCGALWEQPGSFYCVLDSDLMFARTTSHRRPFRFPTRGAGWLDPVMSGMTSRLRPLWFPTRGVGWLWEFDCMVGVIPGGLRMLDKRGIRIYDNWNITRVC